VAFHPAKVVTTWTCLARGAGTGVGRVEVGAVADGGLLVEARGGLTLVVGAVLVLAGGADVLAAGPLADVEGSGEEHDATTAAPAPATSTDAKTTSVRRMGVRTGDLADLGGVRAVPQRSGRRQATSVRWHFVADRT
jgi:hypothetical protein